MEEYEIVVLGAGLTGLSFAYHTERQVAVFEKEPVVGGLIRTVSKGPYKFDLAPHLLHFRSHSIRDLVIENFGMKARTHVRSARIYFEDKLMAYPFELNLFSTSDAVRDDCLAGLDEVDQDIRAKEQELRSGSFENYSLKAFGPGISNHYLLPYNRKIWDIEPSRMTCEWMRFLPTADIEKIRENAFAPNDDSFGYNTHFYYPEVGGIQDLADAFARNVPNILLEHEATQIDLAAQVVTFGNGRQVRYEKLVSTLPLNHLVRISGQADLAGVAESLISTHVYVVNVVIKGRVPDGVHWIYFPNPDLSFFRVSLPKNYFDRSAPDGEQIISVEVSSQEPIADLDALKDKVVEQLHGLSIFDIQELVYTYVHTIPCAYCIYDSQRTPAVNALLGDLAEKNVISTGRYGLWEYSAMEDAIVYGKDLAESLS